jgi:uncharacterized protein YdeI (YjbR/CyaY-like superfamily)
MMGRQSSHMTIPKFFKTAQPFVRWLQANAGIADELLVGFYKVDSGHPSMTWPQAVDEALCFGWIDGVRRRLDDVSYSVRFTPRRRGSVWSAVNIAKYQALQAQGRIMPAGALAFAQRTDGKTAIYAYEQAHTAELSAQEQAAFGRDAAAWAYFEACPAGYKKVMLHWVTTAKKPETRVARLAKLIEACGTGVRLR